MSLSPGDACNLYPLQHVSGTAHIDPTEPFQDMRFRTAQACGNGICHVVSTIRYETSFDFRLIRDTHLDCPTDLLAFSLVVYLALRSGAYKSQSQMPSLFRTMAQDATIYFLVIFTSHLVLELTEIFGRVRKSWYRSMFSFSPAETFVA